MSARPLRLSASFILLLFDCKVSYFMQYFVNFRLLLSFNIGLSIVTNRRSATDGQDAFFTLDRPRAGFLSTQMPVDMFGNAKKHIGCCPMKRAWPLTGEKP
jgi:hypothetical protein